MENKRMQELVQSLNRVHIGIQNLNIQPTERNVAIILDALTVLREAYDFVKKGEEKDGRDDSTGERGAD